MLKHSTLDYRAYVIGVGAALGAAAIGAAGGTGGGLLRDYLNSRYEDHRAELKFGYDSQLAQQQFGFNSALSAQSASQDQNLARLNSALRVQEDSSKYQRAVKDMEAAGLNVGALGSGGSMWKNVERSANANRRRQLGADAREIVQRYTQTLLEFRSLLRNRRITDFHQRIVPLGCITMQRYSVQVL